MKIFKTPDNKLYAFEEDGSQDDLIGADMVMISAAEANRIRASLAQRDTSAVTMRQARLALLNAGLLDRVNSAISSIADDMQRKAAQIEWEFASAVQIDSPLVQSLAPALGLDREALTQLFNAAGSL